MNCTIRRLTLSLLLVMLLIPFSSTVALAHGSTTVGDYTVVVGFHNEPAYQNQPNALDLFVTNTKTKEKIAGLASTLKAEISFGGSKTELKIRPQAGRDGAYAAYVLPSAKGAYTWHIFGTIKNTPIDISMTSSPDTFSTVVDANEVAFPAAQVTPAELQAQLLATTQSAHTALLVGIAGTLLGIIGIAVGVSSLRMRRIHAPRSSGQTQRTV